MDTKSTYLLTASDRQKINKIAHKRAQNSAPPRLYKTEFAKQRNELRVQFCKMMGTGISFERARLEIELAEIQKAINDLA